MNKITQGEPQVTDFRQKNGMEFSFGIKHAFFSMFCFGGGFLVGFTSNILLMFLGRYYLSHFFLFCSQVYHFRLFS